MAEEAAGKHPGTEPAQQLKSAPSWKMSSKDQCAQGVRTSAFCAATPESQTGAVAFNHQSTNLLDHLQHWGFDYFIFASFLKIKKEAQ